MRELPILFSTEMVEAILAGRKCMTRRTHGLEKVNKNPEECELLQFTDYGGPRIFQFKIPESPFWGCMPHYQIGDKMWVRERFETDTDGTVKFYAGNIEVKHNAAYRKLTKWRPGIHLFKKDARIWLECTGVRLERLQDITEADAIAEGIRFDGDFKSYECSVCSPEFHRGNELLCEDGFFKTAKDAFKSLWHSINGVESWNKNPWVFVYEFKGVQHAQAQ